MRSKASIKDHPIHPILIAFPVAFFSGAFFCDLLGVLLNRLDLATMGSYLTIGGVGGGLLAAVPGVIAYVKTVPPDSSAKKRGGIHAIVNSSAMILFLLSYFIR